MRNDSWTKKEDEKLLKLRKEDVTYREIAKIIGRSHYACHKRYYVLQNPGTIKHVVWSEKEEELLAKLWGEGFYLEEISERIGRTKHAVKNKAAAIGLKRKIPRRTRTIWTKELSEEIERLYLEKRLSSSEIARILGTTKNSVIGRLHRMGVKSRLSPSDAFRAYVKRNTGGRKRSKPKKLVLGYVPKKKPRARKFAVPTPYSLKVTLLDAGPRDCRYMEGEDHLCCGHAVKEGTSYCHAHYNICYHERKPERRTL